MSRAHNEDVTGWILRPHFDSTNKSKILRNPANEGKTVRNPVDQGKNLRCPAGESKTIKNPANEGEIYFKFYLIKCLKIPPLLLIQSWILCSKFWTVDRSTCLGMFLQLLMIRYIIFSLVVGGSAYTIFFKKEKSELVRSGDLEHHSTWPRVPILHQQCKNRWTILLPWAGVPSYWNHKIANLCECFNSKKPNALWNSFTELFHKDLSVRLVSILSMLE